MENVKKIIKKTKEIFLEKELITGILIPLCFGFLIFLLCRIFKTHLTTAFFYGGWSTYFFFGAFITFSKFEKLSRKFVITNLFFGFIVFITGIVCWIFWSDIKFLTWPLAIIGILLTVCSFFGCMCLLLKGEEKLDILDAREYL